MFRWDINLFLSLIYFEAFLKLFNQIQIQFSLCSGTALSFSFLRGNQFFFSSFLYNIIQYLNQKMKKNQIYRLCLKAGNFKDTPVFKIKVGKFEKTVNTYFIPADKQRYNYDIYFERSKQPEITIQTYANEKLIGVGQLKFDANKPEMPNENIDIMDGKTKVGALECSLKKLEKKNKKPPMKIRVIQASYNEDLDSLNKMDPFVVVKYADNNYKTSVAENAGKNPVWKQQFNIGTADNDRIFIESWEEDSNGSEFIGVSIIDISTKLGAGEQDVQVTKDKKKQGLLKIEVLQHKSKRPDQSDKQLNDKNFISKRNIKTYAVEAVMKNVMKKGGFIKIQVGEEDVQTTPIFTESRELKWNQSFNLKCSPGQELLAKLCLKDEIEEELGRCSLKINDITNKKYELSIKNAKQEEIGKLYLQFFDEQLNIKQEIPSNKQIKEQNEKKNSISPETVQKISSKNTEIKQRYANRQSIHDYMAEVNAVLQEGLLMIAKERPEDPIKHLGLFLINYKK